MTTDYLGSKFPPYALTEDTAVVRLKPYFRQDGSGYVQVLDSLPTDNPKAKGWYEFKSNHSEEFRFNVGSIQVNNISNLCHSFLNKLEQFPKVTLPRTTSVAGVTLDWRGYFTDSKWNESIGMCVVPPYGVNFTTNLYIAKNINSLVNKCAQLGNSRKTASGWNTLKSDFQGFLSNITPSTGKFYVDDGYKFDPTTLSDATRSDDVFTLVAYWVDIDFREIMRVLQDAKRDTSSLSGINVVKTTIDKMIEVVPNAARTVMDLAMRTNSLDVTSAATFTVRMVTVPGTIVVGSTTFYRLNTKKQLVANQQYGLLLYNNDGSVSILEPETVANPAIRFMDLDLPEYSVYFSTGEVDLPVRMVQDKKVWFTTVPFEGLTS